MTKMREDAMDDRREDAMAEGKMGEAEAKVRDSIWSVPFVILMAVNFFQSMAAFMANATLPVFADSLGATASMVGVVVSSFTLSALLVRPFAGPAFDKLLAQAAPAYRPGHHLPFVFRLRVRRFAGRAHCHPALPRRGHRVQRSSSDVARVRVSAGREVCQRH